MEKAKAPTKNKSRVKRFSRSLHAFLGLCVLIPLLLFTITGVLLNHKMDLGLDQKRLTSEFIMRQYGVVFDGQPKAWDLGVSGSFSEWNEESVLNNSLIILDGQSVGAVEINSGICVATSTQIQFFDSRSTLIEVLEPGLSLPEGVVTAVGVDEKRNLVVQFGNETYVAKDKDLLEFEKIDESQSVQWATNKTLNEAEISLVKKAIIADGLPWDRVILDIHSGNILPLFGKILVDLFALGVLGLTLSGLILYRRKKKGSRATN